jgi:hypothetical protein
MIDVHVTGVILSRVDYIIILRIGIADTFATLNPTKLKLYMQKIHWAVISLAT